MKSIQNTNRRMITPNEIADIEKLHMLFDQLPDGERGYLAGYISCLSAMMQDKTQQAENNGLHGQGRTIPGMIITNARRLGAAHWRDAGFGISRNANGPGI